MVPAMVEKEATTTLTQGAGIMHSDQLAISRLNRSGTIAKYNQLSSVKSADRAPLDAESGQRLDDG